MAERWNMDAVEEFRKRENDTDPLGNLQKEISGEAPAVEAGVTPDGVDPLASLQDQVSGQAAPPTQGVGPFKGGQDYASAINPKGEAERMAIEAEKSSYGFGTVARSAAKRVFPPTDEITANLYNLAGVYANFRPELSTEQWYDILRTREQNYKKDKPGWSTATDIGGAVALAAPAVAGAAIAGVPALAGAAGVAGYGLAMSPWAPEKMSTEEGYGKELATEQLNAVAAPFGGPLVATAVFAPFKVLGRWGGKSLAYAMSKISKDTDTSKAWLEWSKDSQRHINITNPLKAVDDLYDDMTKALSHIKEARANGKIDVNEAKDAYKTVQSEFGTTLEAIRRRADELKIPAAGTAQKIQDQFKNFKKFLTGEGGLYDKSWDFAPSTEAWKAEPKLGVPVKQYYDSMISSVKSNIGGVELPQVKALESEARDLFKFHLGSFVDDALESGAINSRTAEFFKANPDIILNPERFKKLPTVIRLVMDSNGKEMGRVPGIETNGIWVPVSEIRNGYKYVANINPQAMRKYSSSLFKLSDGFVSERDIANGSGKFLSSDVGRKIAGDWRKNILDTISDNDKFPQYKDWSVLNKEAYDINNTFLKPLENRFTMQGSRQEALLNQFVSSSSDFEPQMMNSIKAMSRYGNGNDQTLVSLAERLSAANRASSNLGRLDMDTAIKNMYEQGELVDEATSVLSRLDPIMRNQMTHLEEQALKAADRKETWNRLAKEAEEFAKNNKPALTMNYGGVEGALNKLAGGRKSLGANPGQLSQAADGISNIQRYMNDGDENAANAAMDTIHRLREIALMNKRTVQGSRQTVQAAGLGKIAGAAGEYLLPGMGINSNTVSAAAIVANKFADDFTSKKWSKVTPWVISKMMENKILNYKLGLGRGLLSGQISRAIGAPEYIVDVIAGSPEAMEVINIIKNDKSLNPAEKTKAIKKINEEGIKIKEGK